ncbi:MAG: hypothetical protein Q8Q73_06010 [Stagnimonas sp.]|nr:hypothetical protein [Stagnimonas sp.]
MNDRIGIHKAMVVMANKLARICSAMLLVRQRTDVPLAQLAPCSLDD